MDDAGKLGRQFEFENAFWAKPVKCNFVGVFRRGNKPSVLPREEKRAERKKVGRAWCEPKDF